MSKKHTSSAFQELNLSDGRNISKTVGFWAGRGGHWGMLGTGFMWSPWLKVWCLFRTTLTEGCVSDADFRSLFKAAAASALFLKLSPNLPSCISPPCHFCIKIMGHLINMIKFWCSLFNFEGSVYMKLNTWSFCNQYESFILFLMAYTFLFPMSVLRFLTKIRNKALGTKFCFTGLKPESDSKCESDE